MKRLVMMIAALALGVSAFAQRGGGFGPPSPTGLLGRSDVKKELKITDDQSSKIDAIRQKARDDGRAAFQQASSDGGPPDFSKMGPIMQKIATESDKEIGAILTADQTKRLLELFVQRQGNRSVMNDAVQAKLVLTDDQKSKLTDLQQQQQDAMRQIFQKMQSGEIDRSDLPGLRDKNNKIMDDQISKILTDDQKQKLKDLAGAAFTFDPDENGGGFGGGG